MHRSRRQMHRPEEWLKTYFSFMVSWSQEDSLLLCYLVSFLLNFSTPLLIFEALTQHSYGCLVVLNLNYNIKTSNSTLKLSIDDYSFTKHFPRHDADQALEQSYSYISLFHHRTTTGWQVPLILNHQSCNYVRTSKHAQLVLHNTKKKKSFLGSRISFVALSRVHAI